MPDKNTYYFIIGFYSVLGALLSAVLAGLLYRYPAPIFGMMGPFGESEPSLSFSYIGALVTAWLFNLFFLGGAFVHLIVYLCLVGRLNALASKSLTRMKLAALTSGMIPVVYYSHVDFIFPGY